MKLIRLQNFEDSYLIQFDASMNWLLIPVYNWITEHKDNIKETHLQKSSTGCFFLALEFKLENKMNSEALYNFLRDRVYFYLNSKRKVDKIFKP